MKTVTFKAEPRTTPGAQVASAGPGAWRLSIPAGPAGAYRLAQLDDYAHIRRAQLPWRPPVTLTLHARASSASIPGTWGFGLWNDPFSLSLGFGGGTRRLPTLPNAAWFFFASPPNYLCLQDDLPAQGALASTFRSPTLPAPALALAAPALPLLGLPPAARLFRQLARRWIHQDAARLSFNAQSGHGAITEWHTYTLRWRAQQVIFQVDGDLALETSITPRGPLGLVIWVDNQYAALPPDGHLAYGTLPNPEPVWVEIMDLQIEPG